MLLTRDALLAAAADKRTIEREKVYIKELGGVLIVQAMTGAERDRWERSIVTNAKGKRGIEINTENIRARLAVKCLVDEAGVRLFKDEDAEALGALSAAVLGRVYNVAQRLNGLSDGDIDELKKSSAEGDGSDSLSLSPNASAE